MLFSWRKLLAGPVVKNAVQKHPWSPWSTGNSCSMEQGKCPPHGSSEQLRGASTHSCAFLHLEEKELSLGLLQNETNSREPLWTEQ